MAKARKQTCEVIDYVISSVRKSGKMNDDTQPLFTPLTFFSFLSFHILLSWGPQPVNSLTSVFLVSLYNKDHSIAYISWFSLTRKKKLKEYMIQKGIKLAPLSIQFSESLLNKSRNPKPALMCNSRLYKTEPYKPLGQHLI